MSVNGFRKHGVLFAVTWTMVAAMLLSACAPPPTPQVIKETVVVEKEVEIEVEKIVTVEVEREVEVEVEVEKVVTVEVEKIVTATPVPKVLNFGPMFDAKGLSPDMTSFWRQYGSVENLTTLDPDGNLVPALATEWKMTGDKSWEFKLREGVTFHNGKPFNADVVVFALSRYFSLESARSELKGATVTAKNGYTIEVATKEHLPYLPQLFTNYTTGIMHLDAFNEDGEAIKVIGTGPYELVEWVKDEHATLTKFANYWGGVPKVDTINLLLIPDPHTRATMLKTGELNIARGIPIADAQAMLGDSDIEIMVTPQTRYRVIYLNNSAPPFDDVLVRKAMNYAIDREALVEYVLEGYGTVAQGPFLPTLPWGNPDIKGYTYDPDQAKALLKEAGQENLTFGLCTYSSRPSLPLIAQAVQAQLAEIGVTVNLQVGEYSACKKAVSERTHEAVMIARGPVYGGYDPTTLYASDYSTDGGFNWSIYHNPDFDARLARAQATDDTATRYALCQDLEQTLVDEAVDVFLNYYVGLDAVRKSVSGFTPHRLEMGSPMHLLDIH